MKDNLINENQISQIKQYTKPDLTIIDRAKKMVQVEVESKNVGKENIFFRHKKMVITATAVFMSFFIVLAALSLSGSYFGSNREIEKVDRSEVQIKLIKGNSLVPESGLAKDFENVGKSGKEIFNMVGVKSADDIDKIVIMKDTLSDVSWIPEVSDIIITDLKDISYFYNQIIKIKIVNTLPSKPEWKESDGAKNRTILIYLKDGSVQEVNYCPLSNRIMECFEINGEGIGRKCFEELSHEFNTWLINLCKIDINKDYTDEYMRYKKIQSKLRAIMQFETENWFGGFDFVFVENELKVKVFLVDDSEVNCESVIEVFGDESLVTFAKSNVKFSDFYGIQNKITDDVLRNRIKYPYVQSCGVGSYGVVVGVSSDATSQQINELVKILSAYGEGITIEWEKMSYYE